MAEEDTPQKVGYKRPPESTRFKPGQSGNPRGKRKGYQNVKTDLLEELSEMIPITENGKARKMTKQRVFLKRLCTNAINGDKTSARLLAETMQKYFGLEQEDTNKSDDLTMEDEALLAYYLENKGEI